MLKQLLKITIMMTLSFLSSQSSLLAQQGCACLKIAHDNYECCDGTEAPVNAGVWWCNNGGYYAFSQSSLSPCCSATSGENPQCPQSSSSFKK